MTNALTTAAALEILEPVTGKAWTVVCVWCLHALDPHEQYIARRAPRGGECLSCPYVGPEAFVALLPVR